LRKLYRISFLTFLAAGLVASCAREPAALREALQHFDELANADCPKEARKALARKMGVKSDKTRVILYGPTGQANDTYYFAALNRDGAALAGIFDEARAKVRVVHYETSYDRDDFVLAIKCIRGDPPFGDRSFRNGLAFPVSIEHGAKDITVTFVDAWQEKEQRWRGGWVKLNLAATSLLGQEHDAVIP